MGLSQAIKPSVETEQIDVASDLARKQLGGALWNCTRIVFLQQLRGLWLLCLVFAREGETSKALVRVEGQSPDTVAKKLWAAGS